MLGSTGMSDSQSEIVIDNTPSVLSSRAPPLKGGVEIDFTPPPAPRGMIVWPMVVEGCGRPRGGAFQNNSNKLDEDANNRRHQSPTALPASY